jgi:hypothetical protein
LSALPLDPIRLCAADAGALPPGAPTGCVCPGIAEGGSGLVWTVASLSGAMCGAIELLDGGGAAISASATSKGRR